MIGFTGEAVIAALAGDCLPGGSAAEQKKCRFFEKTLASAKFLRWGRGYLWGHLFFKIKIALFMKRFTFIAISVVLFLGLSSCTDKDALTPTLDGVDVSPVRAFNYKGVELTLSEGRIVIASEEGAARLERVAVEDEDDFNEWASTLTGFTSSEDAYLSVDEAA